MKKLHHLIGGVAEKWGHLIGGVMKKWGGPVPQIHSPPSPVINDRPLNSHTCMTLKIRSMSFMCRPFPELYLVGPVYKVWSF